MNSDKGVHLVGSVAMKDAEEVFRTLAAELGPWLKRLPDGETGARYHWIHWQRRMLLDHPDMEIDPDAAPLMICQWDGKLVRKTELVHFRPGTDPAKITFETGYGAAAIESYKTFRALRDEGVIPQGVRFQVSLPTPMASGYMYVAPAALDDYLPAYERSLMAALDEILGAVAHDDLAIQWDVCQEVLIFENYFPYRPDNYKAQIFDELARLGTAVPEAVELGYHLCYGSPKDEHLVMPKDMGILVEIANGLIETLERRLDFLHMPVPKDRTDAGYYAPLRRLRLPQGAELYLGLIHHDDAQGDQARMARAREVIKDFGIASECGWGRTDPERVPGLIAAHRRAMQGAGA